MFPVKTRSPYSDLFPHFPNKSHMSASARLQKMLPFGSLDRRVDGSLSSGQTRSMDLLRSRTRISLSFLQLNEIAKGTKSRKMYQSALYFSGFSLEKKSNLSTHSGTESVLELKLNVLLTFARYRETTEEQHCSS